MSTGIDQVVSKFEKRYEEFFGPKGGPAFAVRGPDGKTHVLGRGEPEFTVVASDQRCLDEMATLDRLLIAEPR